MSMHRVLAGTLVAAAIGVPGSAWAIGSAGSGSKSATPPGATAHPPKTPGLSDLSALASSAGISESQLQSGLIAAKQAGGNSASAVARFAQSAGVSPATAERIVHSVFGGATPQSLTSPSVVAALATRLGVSTAAAHWALQQIAALVGTHRLDPTSAAFTGIAQHLGVTPSQLAITLKESLRGAAGG